MGGQSLFWHPGTCWLPPEFSAYDYILGAIVSLFIVGLGNAQLPMPTARLERIVHTLAATTFGLHLLYFPLLNFTATITPGPPDGAPHQVLVFVLALSVGIGLARLIEPRKVALKGKLRAVFSREPQGTVLPRANTERP